MGFDIMHDWVFLGTVVAIIASLFYLTLVRPQNKDK